MTEKKYEIRSGFVCEVHMAEACGDFSSLVVDGSGNDDKNSQDTCDGSWEIGVFLPGPAKPTLAEVAKAFRGLTGENFDRGEGDTVTRPVPGWGMRIWQGSEAEPWHAFSVEATAKAAVVAAGLDLLRDEHVVLAGR